MAEINLQAFVDEKTLETIQNQAETIKLMTTSWTIYADQQRQKIKVLREALEAWETFGVTGNHADLKHAEQKARVAQGPEYE